MMLTCDCDDVYVGRCFQNGIYIMNLFDWYSAGFSLVIVAIFEIIAFSYIYGNDVTVPLHGLFCYKCVQCSTVVFLMWSTVDTKRIDPPDQNCNCYIQCTCHVHGCLLHVFQEWTLETAAWAS